MIQIISKYIKCYDVSTGRGLIKCFTDPPISKHTPIPFTRSISIKFSNSVFSINFFTDSQIEETFVGEAKVECRGHIILKHHIHSAGRIYNLHNLEAQKYQGSIQYYIVKLGGQHTRLRTGKMLPLSIQWEISVSQSLIYKEKILRRLPWLCMVLGYKK